MASIIGFVLVYVGASLLFSADRTFGTTQDSTFRVGSIYVEYETFKPRWTKSGRLEFVFLTEEPTTGRTNGFAFGGKTHNHTLVFRDGGTVTFTTKPGETTVWVGKDRIARVVPAGLGTRDGQVIERLRNERAVQVSSLEEFLAATTRLKAEPEAAPNTAPPHQ
jgi:hypothetical protein